MAEDSSEMGPDEQAAALRDDAFVIRGGLMELGPLRNALQTSFVEEGVYELSFFGADGLSVQQIAEAAQQPHPRLPHPKIRVSSAGTLRQRGLNPHPKGVFPHVVLSFLVSPTDNELEELVELFNPPIDNPALSE